MKAGTAQQYARWIGALYLITIVAGGWGESHVPNQLLIVNDLAGTAHQVASSVGLFRASFAAYLIEAACDITLNVLLYALLRPISRNLALLATCRRVPPTSRRAVIRTTSRLGASGLAVAPQDLRPSPKRRLRLE